MNIKTQSGFTWSDEYGAGVVAEDSDAWDRYAKV
jgi:hypothetical protein